MLSFSSQQRYFLYSPATDMRKGVAGLSGLVRQHVAHPLMSGDVFIFINRRRDRIKLLMWDANGFAMYYKQLEKGTFRWSTPDSSSSVELHWSDLVMLLEGIEIKSIKRRKRYQKTG
ncbi:MAG TPA: transposase [Leucothrix mucor]|uniref:Transposase n=1 Tax=Leucothrix mucor TaxID=45248 RepID=A0A7V2WVN1_LEUMU|nr:transposase [Leucothrix mucor]